MNKILDGLNPPQKEAVQHTEGPILILAGAGSGKTRVITHRMAFLIEKGIPSRQILGVTFTNKAAGEMRRRVVRLSGIRGEGVFISTFHSFCARLLRADIDKIDGNPYFAIYDESDQQDIVKDCLRELDLDPKQFIPAIMVELISRAKDSLMDAENYISSVPPQHHFEKVTGEVYRIYQKKIEKNGGLDFGDLLMKTVVMLKKRKDVLEKYQERFRYIMVDEYQDTNYAQYVLIKLLSSKYRNICVVGDDDQNIYTWRGADIRNILEFEKDYTNVRVVKLEQNYRSTKRILASAWHVVRNNRMRKEKKLWTEKEEGEPVEYAQMDTDIQEAAVIVREISRLMEGENYGLRDFAVFYRTNAQSRVFEDVLRKAGMNYRIIGNVRFYDRKEIKDILSYLRLLLNPSDSVSLKRIINVPHRGIGKTTLERIEKYAEKHNMSLFEALNQLRKIENLNARIYPVMEKFLALMRKLKEDKTKLTAASLAREVIEETGYMSELEKEKTTEAENRIENIKELVSAITEFEEGGGGGAQDKSIESFLEQAALVSDIDTWKEEEDYLTLMTLHLAKGLEFPVVFITGMEEGLFPNADNFDDPSEIEEERRLCYVGMTRAKEKLYLTSAAQRRIYGRFRWNVPSRFIEESGVSENTN